MSHAPIALFVYNRPEHSLNTLQALSQNVGADQSKLYIFADGPKKEASAKDLQLIKETRNVIASSNWCKEVEVVLSDTNKGLAKSIVGGVSMLVEKYGKVIILEDDIVTSRGFLKFMNDSLEKFESNDRVMHIGGFLPELTNSQYSLTKPFFSPFMLCWGWATWKKSWEKIILDEEYLLKEINKDDRLYKYNLDGAVTFHQQLEDNQSGKISTWAIKWFSTIFLEDGLCFYPHHSMVQNIGQDGTGINSGKMYYNPYKIGQLLEFEPLNDSIEIEESLRGRKYLRSFYLDIKKKSLKKYSIKLINKVFDLFRFKA